MSISKLQEEFLTGVKGLYHPKNYVEIFVNPTNYEMEQVEKENEYDRGFRFIADGRKKKLFIFSNGEVHNPILKSLGYSSSDYEEAFIPRKQILVGTAKKINNTWAMETSDLISSIISSFRHIEQWEKDYVHMVFNTDWSWVNKYININMEMKSLEDRYKKELNESLFTTTEIKNIYGDKRKIEIFINPSKMEMEKAQKYNSLRFSAFGKSQKIYVFSPEILHTDAFNKTGINVADDYGSDDPIISGRLTRNQGSTIWEFEASDNIWKSNLDKNYNHIKAVYNSDWSFLEKYFEFNFAWNKMFIQMEELIDNSSSKIKNQIKNLTKKKR